MTSAKARILLNGFEMKKLLPLLIFFLPLTAHSEVTAENYCFEASDSIKFEFRTFYDRDSNWSGGFVKYAKSNVPISIVLTDSQDEIIDAEAQWQHTTTWSEVVDGKVTGTYEWVTQGTQIVSMVYTKKSNNKEYSFMNNTNIEASLEAGCKWE